MGVRLTESEAKRLGLAPPKAKARGIVRPPAWNRTEAAYGRHLDLRKSAGQVLWYAYQPISLRLAANTFYRPDFLVLPADLEIRCVEIKGRSGGKWAAHSGLPFYAEDDAWPKVKIAAGLYPFAFEVVWPAPGGGWESRRL